MNELTIQQKTAQEFSEEIYLLHLNSGVSIIESTIEIAEKNNIELEYIKKFLTKEVREMLEAEADNLNFLKGD